MVLTSFDAIEFDTPVQAEIVARICIPVCANSVESLISAAKAASARADIVELRLDYLTTEEFSRLPLDEVIKNISADLIITLRDPKQGGQRDLTPEERIRFWRGRFLQPGQSLFDIELDLADSLAIADWSRVICSHHDFDGVPDNLDQTYARLAQTEAHVIKIAVGAHDVTDCLAVFRLLERACADNRQMIAIAMGDSGIATRILGPSRGGFLTYAASEEDKATAPGQLTEDELRRLYRIEEINIDSAIYGLVGLPAMHSVSPHMHNAAFTHANIDSVYIPFDVKGVLQFFRRMIHPRTRELNWNVRGLSVTAPHKLAVMQALDRIDDDALAIGAVNTVVAEGERLLGYNTDAAGFLAPLVQSFVDLRNARVAVIGAGGAANAVAWALQRENARVTIFARDEVKSARLAERFGASSQKLTETPFGDYDLLVNTTPLGSSGKNMHGSPVRIDQLRGVNLVYDLVYNPIETVLIKQAREAGCKTLSGLEMLVAQAVLQFQLWTGKSAPVDVMHAAGFAALTSSRSDYA